MNEFGKGDRKDRSEAMETACTKARSPPNLLIDGCSSGAAHLRLFGFISFYACIRF